MRLPFAELVAGAAASTVGVTSFIDTWARLEARESRAVPLIAGDPGFDAFTGYPLAVGAAIAGAFLFLGVIFGRALEGSSHNGRYVDAAISLAVLVLLLYGMWEGPSAVLDTAPTGTVKASLDISRGPSLYVATSAAAVMFAASAVGLRGRGKTNGDALSC